MLDVKRLHLLVELSRRGTLAAVAQALSYSPSAVSQQLSVLEREAGVPLLEPVGRRVRLTPAGELLVVHAETVLAELELARAGLAATHGTVGGTVHLAAFHSAVLAVVPAALIALGEAHPGLRVEVTEREPEASLPALLAGEFDLVVGEEYPGLPLGPVRGLDRVPLVEDDLVLAVPASWRPGRRTGLADLADRPFAVEPSGASSRQWVTTACRDAGFEPDVRYTSDDLQVHLRMVEHGLAAALLPALSGVREHAGVAALPLEGAPRRRVVTSARDGARGRPALAAVVAALGEAARAHGATAPSP